MTLKEFYRLCGGDYEDTVARLMNEAFVSRFLHKLSDDHNYSDLCAAIAAHDDRAAFMAAHTLKGMALNLGLTPVHQSASAIAEALRHGWDDAAPALLPALTAAYTQTMAALAELDG